MWQTIRTKLRLEEGATAVEYGIMVALIAIVIVAAVVVLGEGLQDTFRETADCLEEPDACPEGEGG